MRTFEFEAQDKDGNIKKVISNVSKQHKVQLMRMLNEADRNVDSFPHYKAVTPAMVEAKLKERWRMPLYKRDEETHKRFFYVKDEQKSNYKEYMKKKERMERKRKQLESLSKIHSLRTLHF